MAVPREVLVGAVQGLIADQEVLAISFEERASEGEGDPVVEDRTKDASGDAGQDDQKEVHPAQGREVTRRGDHHFAGEGDKGRLQEH